MAAGIPGTGIGGLFYALLALLMPIGRLFARRGRRSAVTWRAVLQAWGLLAGIVGAMWGTIAIVRFALDRRAPSQGTDTNDIAAAVPGLETSALSAAVSLAAVLALVQVLRVVAHRRREAVR